MLQLALVSALAMASQVRLLTADDAPLAAPAAEAPAPEAAPAPAPADAPRETAAPPPVAAKSPPVPQAVHEPLPMSYHYAAGVAAGLVFVPASLYLSEWLGQLSNNLIASALSVLLCYWLIPPIAITAATVLAGNWNDPGHYRWWPALLGTLAVNGISLAVAIFASPALSVRDTGGVLLFTLVQSLAQPAVAVGLERAWPRERQPMVLTAHDPVAPATFFVPTQTWSF